MLRFEMTILQEYFRCPNTPLLSVSTQMCILDSMERILALVSLNSHQRSNFCLIFDDLYEVVGLGSGRLALALFRLKHNRTIAHAK